MTDSVFQSLNDQTKNMFAPLPKLQKLVLENIEKVAELQVDLVKSYAELSAKQFRDFSEVRDLEGLKSFAGSQTEFMSAIGRKLVEDMQTLGQLGSEFREQAARIVREASEAKPEFETVDETPAKAAKTAKA